MESVQDEWHFCPIVPKSHPFPVGWGERIGEKNDHKVELVA